MSAVAELLDGLESFCGRPDLDEFTAMLDGRGPDELCPFDGETWTRLGAYCTAVLERRAAA